MVAILYTQADVDQYKSDDFKATANRMGNGLLAKHDASGPPKEPAVYSARSGKLMDFSLNRKRASQQALSRCPVWLWLAHRQSQLSWHQAGPVRMRCNAEEAYEISLHHRSRQP